MRLLQRLVFAFHLYWQKIGQLFTDGSLIKKFLIQGIEEICPEKIDTLNNINLSANTVTHRIDDISNYFNFQMNNNV